MKKYLISGLTLLLMGITLLFLYVGTNYLLELLVEDYYLNSAYSETTLITIVIISYVLFVLGFIGCILTYKRTTQRKK